MRIRYDKLIRDKIPEVIERSGSAASVRILDDKEFEAALKAKLREEVDEFFAEPSADELVDVLEVLLALGNLLGVNHHEIERVRMHKKSERGAFEKRLFLEFVDERETR